MSDRILSLAILFITACCAAAQAQNADTPDKVAWKDWGKPAFEQAKSEKNMILLNIAPSWSHQTQWMDLCTYSQPDIAEYINRRFIAIRVDPDARPDVDTRYQAAAGALFGESGWPLTVSMMSTGEPVSAGTVLKPSMSSDQPGMLSFLAPAVRAYRENVHMESATRTVILNNQKEMREKIGAIIELLRAYQNETTLGTPVTAAHLDEFSAAVSGRFDPIYAGFTKPQAPAPKMVSGSAIRLALALGNIRKDPQFTLMGTRTLDAMLGGGVYDHVSGGFHHYATDREWGIPRFEKLASINAEALMACAAAYRIKQDPRYRRALLETVSFIQETLAAPEGGFYAAQAADLPGVLGKREHIIDGEKLTVLSIDNGSWHSWSLAELQSILAQDELQAVAAHFAVDASGEVEDLRGKNVLDPVGSIEDTAAKLSIDAARAQSAVDSALGKMKAARKSQPAPPVDKALYTNYNGLVAAALFDSGRVLGMPEIEAVARAAVDRLWNEAHAPGKGVAHAVGTANPDLRLLTDQVGMAYGLITAFEHTGDIQYFQRAKELMDWTWANLRDSRHGGLYDRVKSKDDAGLLELPWKSIQDLRYPADNSLAAWVYDRLYYFSKDKEQKKRANEILEALRERAVKQGPDAAWFGMAMVQHLHPPTFVVILGSPENAGVQTLVKAAAAQYDPNRIIMVLGPDKEEARALIGGYPRKGDVVAYVCIEDRCSRPLTSPEDLLQTIEQFRAPQAKNPLGLDEL